MKTAIMQPYLFPYIGYFQLMSCVDHFVFYDDVQYINRGWINRNRILVNHSAHLFSFSLKKDSSHLNISDRYYSDQFDSEKSKFIKALYLSYRKAPYFSTVIEVIERILAVADDNVASFNVNLLQEIGRYLNINIKFSQSSQYTDNLNHKGESRIIDLCQKVGGTHYINPVGGQELYSKKHFAEKGIQLSFLKTKRVSYRQFGEEFVPSLSIIDVMMFNSKDELNSLLQEYEMV